MQFGFCQPNVANLTAEFNLGVRRKHLSREAGREIRARIEAGERAVEIARSMGLPERQVYDRKYKLRQQRQLELPQSRPDPKYDLAQQMWAEGKKIREIAAAYDFTPRRMGGVIEHYRKVFLLFPKRRKYKRRK